MAERWLLKSSDVSSGAQKVNFADESETLDQFTQAEYDRLERFRQFWLKGMREQPDQFPATMEPGDWDEQYRVAETLDL